jgi:hypothetical protein
VVRADDGHLLEDNVAGEDIAGSQGSHDEQLTGSVEGLESRMSVDTAGQSSAD